MKSTTERPVGISFLGILLLIVGPLTIVAPAAVIQHMPLSARVGVGVVEICLGIGLLLLRHWALVATITFYGLAFMGALRHPIPHFSVIVFSGLIIAYLCMPGVRKAFESHSVVEPPAALPNS